MSHPKNRVALITGAIGAVLVTVSGANAASITVPGDHATIQGAIDASANFDEILVGPGTYNEAIVYGGKRITIRSTDGPEATILDGAGLNASIVTFTDDEDADSVLEGFTLRNGTGTSLATRLGGAILVDSADPVIRTCIIHNNSADDGGAIYADGALFSLNVVNCAIYDNTAARGGAVYLRFSNPAFRNCTVANNIAESSSPMGGLGGGFYGSNSTIRIANCIVWANTPDGVSGSAITTYSNIQGGVGGTTNISQNPVFTNPGADNYKLQASSPCVDRADSTVVSDDIFVDVAGGPRGVNDEFAPDLGIPVFGLVVDMGSYERQGAACTAGCTGDIDGDKLVGFNDLLQLLALWGPCK